MAFGDADLASRAWFRERMRAAGLTIRTDAAGNIFGRRAGRDNVRPPVLFGSHLDSVPSGGNFDGVLGALAGLEIMQSLAEAGITTRLPLELAA